MIEREDRRRAGIRHVRPLTLPELRDRMEGPHEHIARYKAFVELIYGLDLLPKFVVVDRSTEPRPVPIDVDIVIDLGNSRTCGLLIEAQPDQLGADITQAVKLQLRDLSRPELVYSDPFDSRLEFSRASFGRDHLSLRSGRAEAFAWPTIVRVGPEATRLASLRRGSEGATGLSGPKRYLWDDDPRRDSWRFNSPTAHGEQTGLATGVAFTTLVNDARRGHSQNPVCAAGQRRVVVSVDPRALRAAQPDVVRARRDLRAGDLHDERAVAPAAPPQRRPAAPAQADHHDHPDGDAARRTADHAAAGGDGARPRLSLHRRRRDRAAGGRPVGRGAEAARGYAAAGGRS